MPARSVGKALAPGGAGPEVLPPDSGDTGSEGTGASWTAAQVPRLDLGTRVNVWASGLERRRPGLGSRPRDPATRVGAVCFRAGARGAGLTWRGTCHHTRQPPHPWAQLLGQSASWVGGGGRGSVLSLLKPDRKGIRR